MSFNILKQAMGFWNALEVEKYYISNLKKTMLNDLITHYHSYINFNTIITEYKEKAHVLLCHRNYHLIYYSINFLHDCCKKTNMFCICINCFKEEHKKYYGISFLDFIKINVKYNNIINNIIIDNCRMNTFNYDKLNDFHCKAKYEYYKSRTPIHLHKFIGPK